jgi:hypothetical protein
VDEVPGKTKTDNQVAMQSMSDRREPGTSGRSPSRVLAVGLQLLGAVLLATAVIVGVFVSHAGATDLSNGTVAIETSGGTVETSPLSIHQLVTVKVGPNSTLSRSSLEAAGFPSGAVPIKIIECADPGGLTANLPLSEKQCEPETIDPNGTALENGSMVEPGFTVYSLPDTAELGNSSGTVCDMQHQCVLGIFSNQLDFTKPHLFSAPFLVNPTSTSGGTSSDGSTASTSPTTTVNSSATVSGASAAVSVPPATLANTGGPDLWPWLLGAGAILLVAGTVLRGFWRPAPRGRR